MTYRYRRFHRHFSFYRYMPLYILLLVLLSFSISPSNDEEELSVNAADYDPDAVSFAAAETSEVITLYRTDTGELISLPMEEYIVGVTAAEMPSSFSSEALKAQSVIARTYACWKMQNSMHDPGHGDLCDDSGHCQAYYSLSELKAQWGGDFDMKYEKIADAVAETSGMILTYDGDLAETYYHSTCGGKTASAKEVWGEEIPYLQSVTCKWDKDAPRYCETVSVSLSRLPWLLGDGISPCIAVAEGETVSHVPSICSETESGRSLMVSYAGLMFEAKDFRNALGLNSTHFTMETKDDMLYITTYGFGHGVGLCQYGANGLAEKGKTFDEILAYYYKDTSLQCSN